jgi:hypothetical protein
MVCESDEKIHRKMPTSSADNGMTIIKSASESSTAVCEK